MGKCLSCCEPEEAPTQNGHPGSTATPTKSTTASAGGLGAAVPPSAPSHDMHPSPPAGRGTLSNGDRRMFVQYTKLPPIRKCETVEGRRGVAACTSQNTGSQLQREVSDAKLAALFEMYCDPQEDAILEDGIEGLCADLGVRPEEFRVLVFAWKLEAETMCRFTRSEFTNGCRKLHVDSLQGIRSKFPEMLAEVQHRPAFKDLYRWTYKFGLDADAGQRTLPVDMAVSLWQLVFSQTELPILKRWLEFLDHHPAIRGIPRDTWDMFLNFTDLVGEDLSSYDDTEAWPSLFDDFVEFENDRQNQNLQPDLLTRDKLDPD